MVCVCDPRLVSTMLVPDDPVRPGCNVEWLVVVRDSWRLGDDVRGWQNMVDLVVPRTACRTVSIDCVT